MPITYKIKDDKPLVQMIATFPHFFQSIFTKLIPKTVIEPNNVVAASTAPLRDSEFSSINIFLDVCTHIIIIYEIFTFSVIPKSMKFSLGTLAMINYLTMPWGVYFQIFKEIIPSSKFAVII